MLNTSDLFNAEVLSRLCADTLKARRETLAAKQQQKDQETRRFSNTCALAADVAEIYLTCINKLADEFEHQGLYLDATCRPRRIGNPPSDSPNRYVEFSDHLPLSASISYLTAEWSGRVVLHVKARRFDGRIQADIELVDPERLLKAVAAFATSSTLAYVKQQEVAPVELLEAFMGLPGVSVANQEGA